MICLQNVYMAFTKNYYSLYDVNLTLNKGEKLAILGEVDSGKTCFLRLILGLDKPIKGTVKINDKASHLINFAHDIKTLYLPVDGIFLEHKSCFKNIEYILEARKERHLDSDILIYSALKTYGLISYKDVAVKKLSPFNRIMLSLARASFRTDLDLIVVDDIFLGLSESEKMHILKHLKNLFDENKEATIILASSNKEIVDKLNFKKATLNSGVFKYDV